MASVVLGRAPVVAPDGFGRVGVGAWGGAQRCRWCSAGRRGWRLIVWVVVGRAPGVAPNCCGGEGPGAGGGA